MQLVPHRKRHGGAMSLHPFDKLRASDALWDPFGFFSDSMFSLTGGRSMFVPSVDISEDEKQITVVADLPGYDPENVDVTLEDNILTIQGKMEESKEEKDDDQKWYRKECSSGCFYRRFSLPQNIKEDAVACKSKNGKLTVTIPKKEHEEKPKGKKLEIEVE